MKAAKEWEQMVMRATGSPDAIQKVVREIQVDALSAPPRIDVFSAEERRLWAESYMAALKSDSQLGRDMAESSADRALEAFRKRFP